MTPKILAAAAAGLAFLGAEIALAYMLNAPREQLALLLIPAGLMTISLGIYFVVFRGREGNWLALALAALALFNLGGEFVQFSFDLPFVLLGTGFTAVMAIGGLIAYGTVASPVQTRGSALLSQKEAEKRVRALARKSPAEEPQVIFGGLAHPKRSIAPHSLLLGQTGSGKTLLLWMTLRSLLFEGDRLACRAIVFDHKFDAIPMLVGAGVRRDAIQIMNVFDARGVFWDMAADVRDESDANAVTHALIEDEPNAAQPYWFRLAQSVVYETILSLIRTTPHWTFTQLIIILQQPSLTMEVLRRTESGRRTIAVDLSSDKKISEVFSEVRTKVLDFVPIARLARDCRLVSLEQWFQSQSPTVLVLGSRPRAVEQMRALNKLLMRRATQIVLSRPEEYPPDESIFVFDEVREIGDVALRQVLTGGRSKSCRCVIAGQDVSGLIDVWGEHQANEMLSSFANVALLRMKGDHAAGWASRFVGQYEAIRTSYSVQMSRGTVTEGETSRIERIDAILPQEFHAFSPNIRQAGIDGVFMTESVPPWRGNVSPEVIGRYLPKADAATPSFEPRPTPMLGDLRLNDADLHVLGLAPAPPDSPSPNDRRRKFRTF